jgi:hypothetical protein
MPLSKMPQELFAGLHSDRWTGALRAIPSDIAVTLPEHQLAALVRSIDDYVVQTLNDHPTT